MTFHTDVLPVVAVASSGKTAGFIEPSSFELDEPSFFKKRGALHVSRERRRATRPGRWASIVMSPEQKVAGAAEQNRQNMQPLFRIAASPQEAEVVPAWRTLAGNLASGAVAGCTVEAVLYPIDTIKTRLQAMTSGGGFNSLFKGSGSGMGKLYSGLIGNLVGVAPATAIFFGVYEPVKQQSKKYMQEDAAPLVAGSVAGLAASIVRVPTEVIKQRMQTREFSSAMGAVAQISRKEGIRGLFAGYGAFLLRDLPFDAVEFFTYEVLKSAYQKRVKRELKAYESAVAGAISGGFTGLVTTPFDVLKTRLMTQGSTGRYANVFDATKKILQEEGAGAFFKGWQPRLIWISIGGCVFFTALEQSRKLFLPKSHVEKDHKEA
ncbi:hypothetical protein BSKO_07354 [Bryopsis sp. KO-2023]|nr:hypothetical protein BSKO_07354 [Bryopsis sp. KO-2023]